eukprot:1915135-Lingulodinium_polyedra.AAC.1
MPLSPTVYTPNGFILTCFAGEMLSKFLRRRTSFHVLTKIMMTMTFRHVAGFWDFLVHSNKGQNTGKYTCFGDTASLHRRAQQRTKHPYDMKSYTWQFLVHSNKGPNIGKPGVAWRGMAWRGVAWRGVAW